MPYKLSADGKTVLVWKDGKWTTKKRYTGKNAKARALAYFRVLKTKVSH